MICEVKQQNKQTNTIDTRVQVKYSTLLMKFLKTILGNYFYSITIHLICSSRVLIFSALHLCVYFSSYLTISMPVSTFVVCC